MKVWKESCTELKYSFYLQEEQGPIVGVWSSIDSRKQMESYCYRTALSLPPFTAFESSELTFLLCIGKTAREVYDATT